MAGPKLTRLLKLSAAAFCGIGFDPDPDEGCADNGCAESGVFRPELKGDGVGRRELKVGFIGGGFGWSLVDFDQSMPARSSMMGGFASQLIVFASRLRVSKC